LRNAIVVRVNEKTASALALILALSLATQQVSNQITVT